MDITPLINETKKIITKYSANSFTINAEKYEENILIIHDKVITFSDNDDPIDLFLKHKDNIEILIIGTGKEIIRDNDIMKRCPKNISIEFMNNSSAIRTFNILNIEDREVAVILKLPN